MELFDIGPWVAFSALAVTAAVFIAAIVYFVRSAPPTTITISSGPDGSNYFKIATKYAKILERNRVKVNVLTSKGSVENLSRLLDPKANVDVGLVGTGPATPDADKLVSLGSVSNQPVLVFYRGKSLTLLSELKGKKVSVGPEGSGTRAIALAILALNDIKPGEVEKTELLDFDADDAEAALKAKRIDAAFVMGESATPQIMKSLLRAGDIHLYSFKQANGYSRKLEYLHVLELPEGTINLGQNLPDRDVTLLGTTVEVIADHDLHPALVDLLVEAETEVHSRPGLFQRRGDFPAPTEHTIKMSDEAVMYFKSGKGYLYRNFPFWLASLLSRILVVFVPVLLVTIPALRSIPAFFRWIARLRIRRRYRELRILEQRYLTEKDAERRESIRREFDRIDENLHRMKVRASFADQYYGLREHIDYVRRVLDRRPV
ncbi:MAG: hypothetical protein JST04_16120 [Bdellovibrionales bacterium]|nr:hypothetical protein [Bdellovibrionales bacterium]